MGQELELYLDTKKVSHFSTVIYFTDDKCIYYCPVRLLVDSHKLFKWDSQIKFCLIFCMRMGAATTSSIIVRIWGDFK